MPHLRAQRNSQNPGANPSMNKRIIVSLLLLTASLIAGQINDKSPPPAKTAPDYSGMYTFLREGEFVQVTVEEAGRVTGFVSRYGDLESDKGTFLDHFFKEGKLDGNKIGFTTVTVHGVWFEFKGSVDRGTGKNTGDEAYFVLNGTLTQYTTDASKRASSKSTDVSFKLFPKDMTPAPGPRD